MQPKKTQTELQHIKMNKRMFVEQNTKDLFKKIKIEN